MSIFSAQLMQVRELRNKKPEPDKLKRILFSIIADNAF